MADDTAKLEGQEKGVTEEELVPESDFPDGGLKAWLVVFGVCLSHCNFSALILSPT